jgi:uncharacterized membrane protein HdeD (DUF308 family)
MDNFDNKNTVDTKNTWDNKTTLDNKNNQLDTFYGIRDLGNNKNWFLAIGIALILLGIISVATATFVTLASMIFFGALLLAGGVVQAFNAFKTRHGQGFFLSLLGGIFYCIVGALMIRHPVTGALTFTLLLAAFYAVGGIFKIVASLTHHFENWGWVLLNGCISLLLGILIWNEWPNSGMFIIGLFIGIDLIMVGWVWVALALAPRKSV